MKSIVLEVAFLGRISIRYLQNQNNASTNKHGKERLMFARRNGKNKNNYKSS